MLPDSAQNLLSPRTPAPGELTLLSPKLPPEAAFWMGGLPTLEELAEEYGATRWAAGIVVCMGG